jgi:hypothetical protein
MEGNETDTLRSKYAAAVAQNSCAMDQFLEVSSQIDAKLKKLEEKERSYQEFFWHS